MKKVIPIKIQKIISFIPLLNLFILFIWVYNSMVLKVKQKVFFKSLFVTCSTMIVFAIPFIIMSYVIGEDSSIYTIAFYFSEYLIPLAIGWELIIFQEKLVLSK